MNYILAFALGLGFAAGLRSFTPPVVVAWAAHIGWLNLNNSPLAFMGSTITAVIFSLLALFELFLDLQPSTPKRTAPFPLVARILTGGLCGACLCAASNQSLIIGAILGAIGGVIGAFAGYEIRRRLVAALNIKDIFVALKQGPSRFCPPSLNSVKVRGSNGAFTLSTINSQLLAASEC